MVNYENVAYLPYSFTVSLISTKKNIKRLSHEISSNQKVSMEFTINVFSFCVGNEGPEESEVIQSRVASSKCYRNAREDGIKN